jgi:putative FmdB family regulatory protein
MPLYEYQCDACGHRFEVIQKFSDPPVTVCPKCGGQVHKLLSSPAIQFKGSGFYITDYARAGKSEGEGGPAATAGSNGTESKQPGTTDAKPEAKAEPKPAPKSESKSEKPTPSKPASD